MTSLQYRISKRHFGKLALTFTSLVVGAMTLATVLGLVGSVRQFFLSQSQELTGGDIAIETHSPIDIAQSPTLSRLKASGASFSVRIDTLGNALSNRDREHWGKMQSLLITMKVVDQNYPLYGTLTLAHTSNTALQSGELFVAPDILERMGVVIGDSLTIGKKTFVIKDTITHEPDQIAGSFRLGPLVIMSKDGWNETGIIGAQSRLSYTTLIRLNNTISASERTKTIQTIESEFRPKGAHVRTAENGQSTLLRIIDNAERFFLSIIMLSLFLIVVNIRINLTYFLVGITKTIALLKTLGMQDSRIGILFLTLLLSLSAIAGSLGTFLGNLGAHLLIPFVKTVFAIDLVPPTLSSNIIAITLFTTVLCLLSALPFFAKVRAISPKSLLLGYGTENAHARSLSEIPFIVLLALSVFLGVWYLTKSLTGTLIGVGSIAGIFLALIILIKIALVILYRKRMTLRFTARALVAFLHRQGMVGIAAIASLSVALGCIFAVSLIQANVLGNLNNEFRKDAPNIYLLDIQTDQLAWLRDTLGPTWRAFPVLRGRFMLRNTTDIQSSLDKEDPELGREFNLTYRDNLIEGEQLTEGVWHGTTTPHAVSVESGFAKRAKISLGDDIVFLVQGIEIRAKVTSMRTVTETNGLPFFYFVFSPDLLQDIPQTAFGYAYINDSDIPSIQNQLAARYPNISSIPTTEILEAVRRALLAVSFGVNATAIPALVLGSLLALSMIFLSASERANDMLVFMAFGATRKRLFSLFLAESLMSVASASVFGSALAFLVAWQMNRSVFAFHTFYISTSMWYIILSALLFSLAVGSYFSWRFAKSSPVELLRKN